MLHRTREDRQLQIEEASYHLSACAVSAAGQPGNGRKGV